MIASAAGRTIGPGTARRIDEGNCCPFAAAADGIAILIEALNDRDNPGYFITHQLEAVELVRRVDRPEVAVQLDSNHAQIMDGDLASLTERMAGSFGHVQIASVPGRHEPGRGEIRMVSQVFLKTRRASCHRPDRNVP